MVFFIVAGAIGIAQIAASINYLKTLKTKILLFCFGVEGIYYVLMTIVLLSIKADIAIKIMGVIIACIMLIVIYTAIKNLWENITSQR